MAKPDRKPDPDFEPDYDTADPDYDDVAQSSFDEATDLDYEEGRQIEYDTDFADDEASEGSQEYAKRSQK